MRTETAYLAGGCYWGMEELFRALPGILETEVGFSGGHIANVAYREVTTGTTGHAETLKVVFDPEIFSYRDVLFEFFRIHNPTKPNQQGNDIGTQYRSVIFYVNDPQKETALAVIAQVDHSGVWQAPIVTEVTPFKNFYAAEERHQKYLMKVPDGYTCHFRRNFDFGDPQ